MPLLTPSRVIVLVISLTLFSFIWSWSSPSALPAQQFPASQQDQKPAHEEPSHQFDPDKPEYESPEADTPQPPSEQEGENKEESLITSILESLGQKSETTPTPTPKPKQSEGVKEAGKPTRQGNVADTESTTKEEEAQKVTGTQSSTEKSVATDIAAAQNGTTLVKVISSAAPMTSVDAAPTPSATPIHEKFCNKVKGAPHLMIIVRTSRGEKIDKLSAHLKTLLTCAPSSAIFSDHTGEIEGHKIHNVLEDISPDVRAKHDEFKNYDLMQTQDIEPGSAKGMDKWKFLPMVRRAYELNKSARFYLFIEADTSLSWTNALQWINRLDYRIPYYSGAPNFMGDVKFAQRGAGIFISQGAMRQYAKTYAEKYLTKWEPRIAKECCGDVVLATAMADSHVEFYSSFPMIQGEKPHTLDWTKKNWCAPMITWHHMDSSDIDMVWASQSNWTHTHGWNEPYLYKHAFAEYIRPHLKTSITEWDNISADSKVIKPAGSNASDQSSEWGKYSEELRKSVESAEECRKLCEGKEDCVQWKHSTNGEGECYSGKVIRLGRKALKEEGKPVWTSGWVLERLEKVFEEWECTKGAVWKFNR